MVFVNLSYYRQSRSDMLAEFALSSMTADLVVARADGTLTQEDYLAATARQNALLNRVDLGLEFVKSLVFRPIQCQPQIVILLTVRRRYSLLK